MERMLPLLPLPVLKMGAHFRRNFICKGKFFLNYVMAYLIYIYSFIIFVAGLTVGSFLNVVIYRLENGEKIVNDRSRCLHCKHTLAWYDLIPVLSFIFLKGKCRYCNNKISWQYPLVELSTAILFIMVLNFQFSIFNFQFLIPVLYLLFMTSSLIAIFIYDLKHYIIPDKVIYPAIAIALGFNLFNNIQYPCLSDRQAISNILSAFNFLIPAFLAGGFFYAIVAITKGRGMGGGDVKLAFLMGLILGWPVIIFSVFLAFISGSVVGIYLILAGKKKMKSMIPFGPFLIFGTFAGLFWGKEIVERYFDVLI